MENVLVPKESPQEDKNKDQKEDKDIKPKTVVQKTIIDKELLKVGCHIFLTHFSKAFNHSYKVPNFNLCIDFQAYRYFDRNRVGYIKV